VEAGDEWARIMGGAAADNEEDATGNSDEEEEPEVDRMCGRE